MVSMIQVLVHECSGNICSVIQSNLSHIHQLIIIAPISEGEKIKIQSVLDASHQTIWFFNREINFKLRDFFVHLVCVCLFFSSCSAKNDLLLWMKLGNYLRTSSPCPFIMHERIPQFTTKDNTDLESQAGKIGAQRMHEVS